MRTHLLRCSKGEEFTSFLKNLKHNKWLKGHIFYVNIYCICRGSFYEEDSKNHENLLMLKCAKCGEWYHKMYEMLEHKFRIEKHKKDFVFSQLKTNITEWKRNWLHQFLSFFFPNIDLWDDFFHIVFVSLKFIRLLQILKLAIQNVRPLCIAFLNIVDEVSLYF